MKEFWNRIVTKDLSIIDSSLNICFGTGVRAISGPPEMGTPGPRIARDIRTGVPEISSDMGAEGPRNAGDMGIL